MKIVELLDIGVQILEKELQHLMAEVDNGPLSFQSAQTLNQCVRTLVIAAKGHKDADEEEDERLAEMSDDELVALAEEQLKSLKSKKKGEKKDATGK